MSDPLDRDALGSILGIATTMPTTRVLGNFESGGQGDSLVSRGVVVWSWDSWGAFTTAGPPQINNDVLSRPRGLLQRDDLTSIGPDHFAPLAALETAESTLGVAERSRVVPSPMTAS